MLNCESCGHKVEYDGFVWCPIIRAFIWPQNINCGRFCDYHTGRCSDENPTHS